MAALDFTETRFVPAFRDIIRDPAVVEEFDRLAAFLRAALAGSAQQVAEVRIESGPITYFDGSGALVTTPPEAAVAASDGVTNILNQRYTTQILNRYHTVFREGVSDPDGNVSGGGGGTISAKSKDLSDGQIKSLNTSPVEIIEAPGVGKALIPYGAIVSINFPATAYSAAPAGTIIYTSTAAALSLTLRLSSTGRRMYFAATSSLDITTISQIEDQALEFTTAANVTGGDAENQFRVTVLYRTISLV